MDKSNKLDEIEKLIEQEHYFTINRARQYGKTTTLYHLEKKLEQTGAQEPSWLKINGNRIFDVVV